MRIEKHRPRGNKPKSGSRILNRFLGDLAGAIEKRINRSAGHAFVGRDDPEMPFWYNEQTTKGIVSAAIDEITGTNFFQEYSIKRTEGRGRVDYWLEYGSLTTVQILLEVKQSWARIYNDDVTIYSKTAHLLSDAKKQLDSIEDKATYANFSIGMLIMPLYSRYVSDDDTPIELSQERIECLREKIETNFNSTLLYEVDVIKTLRKYNKIHCFRENSRDIFESHPGICLIYYVRKLTKN